MKIIDLDEIYNFLVLSFFSLRCLKKINGIFRPEGIFDFSHPLFDTVRTKSDGSGVKDKKVQTNGTCDRSTFLMAYR